MNCCPEKHHRRFLVKGEKRLKKEFNYIKIIKDIKKLQKNQTISDIQSKDVKAKIHVDHDTSSDDQDDPLTVIRK